MQTIDKISKYALVQHSLPKPSIGFVTLTPRQRWELLEEFKDETDPCIEEMIDFLDLGDNFSNVTLYNEKPEGWPE